MQASAFAVASRARLKEGNLREAIEQFSERSTLRPTTSRRTTSLPRHSALNAKCTLRDSTLPKPGVSHRIFAFATRDDAAGCAVDAVGRRRPRLR